MFGHHIDGNAVNHKGGTEGDVSVDGNLARIGGDAVAPLHEVVVVGGGGIEGGHRSVGIAAVAGEGAIGGSSEGHSVGVGSEVGHQYDVAAADGDGADGVGVAIAPAEEVAVGGGTGAQGVATAVGGAGGAAEGGAHGRVATQGRDGVLVGLGEDGADEDIALADGEGAAGIGAGILPTDEAVEVGVVVDVGDGEHVAIVVAGFGGSHNDVAHEVVVGGGVEGVGDTVELGGEVEHIGGNGEDAGIVAHAVAPLGEGNAAVGSGLQHYARIIYITTIDFGVDRTQGNVGSSEAELEAVASEDGGVGAVGVEGNQAAGGRLAVVPTEELAVLTGHGLDANGAGAIGAGVATADGTQGGVVGHDADGVFLQGGESHVVGGAVDHDGAGVDGIAVAPAHELVMFIGGGGDGDSGAVGVAATAGGGGVGARHVDGHIRGGESGSNHSVAGDVDIYRGEGAFSAIPSSQMLTCQRGSGEAYDGVVGEAAATGNKSLGVVGREGGEGVGLGGEDGLIGGVGAHIIEHAVVAGVAVAPHNKLVVLGGVGGEDSHVAVVVGLFVASHGAPLGVVGGEGDHVVAGFAEVGHDVGVGSDGPVEGVGGGAVDAPVGELVGQHVGGGDGDDIAVLVGAVDGGGYGAGAGGGADGDVVGGLDEVGGEG